MKTQYTVALAMLTGIGLGALAVQGLYAQAKPPAYVIAEIDVANQDGYVKEYLQPAEKAVLAGGATYLARGSKTASIKGEPPKRIVLLTLSVARMNGVCRGAGCSGTGRGGRVNVT